MTQDVNNNKDNLDQCPDAEVLKACSEGGASEAIRSIVESHLEFCASCRNKLESMGKPAVPVEKSVEILAHRLQQRQQQILQKQSRGPVLGTIWRAVPASEQDLYGPMVIVIDENKDRTDIVQVAEISEDIPQAIETDMILEPTQSRLSFRCMVRTGNTFFTDKKNLKTLGGKLSPLLTTKVVRFCKSQNQFNDEVPLSEYVFLRDQEGNELMRRRGVTSGMLVTKDDDSRLSFLEQSKQRCSYLYYDQEVPGWGVAAADVAASTAPETVSSSLVKKLWPIAAMILVAVISVKTTQVIVEAPLKSEAQVAAAKIRADEGKRQAEAERDARQIAQLEQERSNLATKSVNLEAQNSKLNAEIKKMAESIAVSQESRISTRSEMEALKAKVSKIEVENLDLKKSNTELLAIQDRINKRLAQAEEGRAKLSMSMEVVPLKFDSAKGKELLEAVHSGDMAALKELLREEEYANYRDNDTGLTPLLAATSEGQTAAAKFLIEKGAYVNAVDRERQTPLMMAAMKGDRGMVELLLDKGADTRMSDMGGRNALYWALANKHDDIADLLRKF